jgi:lysophospholipase L1-like esterase
MIATRPTRAVRVAALLAAMTIAAGATSAAAQASTDHLFATWGPSMTIGGPTFNNQTIRMVVHTSIGGKSVRVELSNLRSTTPLSVGAVDLAEQATAATAVPGTHYTVTFSHSPSVTIPTGAELLSDPIPMKVGAGENLLVSIDLPQATTSATWHSDAFDTSYLSVPGNHTRDDTDGNFTTATTSWYYLSGVDVMSSKATGTVVTFGDSITDGYNTPTGAYATWPDDLARRLTGTNPMAVVNAGIGGNRVLTDVPNIWQGISAIKRFGHDALEQPGVRDVVLLEGINDIGNNAGPNGAPLTVQDLVDGYRNLIGQAHAAGVRIIGATMLPDYGNGYYSSSAEDIRQAANDWIRTSGAFDGVIDFDKVMRDPANLIALNPSYDSGDHLHPNAAGMQAMANAVDLQLLN